MYTRSQPKNLVSGLESRNTFISVSKLRNYILRDEFSDVVKHQIKPIYKHNVFASQGIQYEKNILDIIKSKVQPNEYRTFLRYNEYENAIKCMNEKIPILSQVPLKDDDLKIRGIADLLVRKDYLKKIFDFDFPSLNISDDMYVVFDIKFSKIPTISGFVDDKYGYKYYKYQTMLYSHMLGNIQGVKCKNSFIIGKGIYGESGNPFQSIGIVDNRLCSLKLVKKALQFLDCIEFMSIDKFEPNMKVKSYDHEIENVKINTKGIPKIPYTNFDESMIVSIINIPNIICTDPMKQNEAKGCLLAIMVNINGKKTMFYSKDKNDEKTLLKKFVKFYKSKDCPKLIGYNFYNTLRDSFLKYNLKTKYSNIIRKMNYNVVDVFEYIKEDFPNTTLSEIFGENLDFDYVYKMFIDKKTIEDDFIGEICCKLDDMFIKFVNTHMI